MISREWGSSSNTDTTTLLCSIGNQAFATIPHRLVLGKVEALDHQHQPSTTLFMLKGIIKSCLSAFAEEHLKKINIGHTK